MSDEGARSRRSTDSPALRLRLDSWKEIATYLKRSQRTVRRWEREEGLPVKRHLHHKQGTIYAFAGEIDTWLKSREKAESIGHAPGPPAPDESPGPTASSARQVPPGRPIVIAVLPLKNLGRDPAEEMFSDALTDGIISELGQLSPEGFRVIASTSVAQYKRATKSIKQIGRELGLDYVVEGDVRRHRGRVRLTARLIGARDETRILAENLETQFPPLFSLPEELARRLSNALSANLSLAPTGRAGLETNRILAAHDAYVAATSYFGWSEAEIKKMIDHFSLAIERDPNCAAAFAELALAYTRLGVLYDHPPNAIFGRAKELALKALSLDPGLPRTHSALALYNLYGGWNWSEAEACSRRAIELNPSDSRAHIIRAVSRLVTGRRAEAVEDLKQAHRLDPYSSTIGMGYAIFGFLTGRYDLASERCEELLRRDPSSALAHLVLGIYYVLKGDNARAVTHCKKAEEIGRGQILCTSALCYAYSIAGQRDSAERLLGELVAAEKQQYVRYIFLAQAAVGLGINEQTLDWLEKAYEQHDPLLVFLKADPRFESMSRSPQFRELLSRIGLPG